jgi:4-hydroxy-2-oxoheptanedioate aldolase
VRHAKFAPIGHRGFAGGRSAFGEKMGEYTARANAETMVVVMLEEVEALRNLDDILKVEHVDVFFVAPNDLATSMGHIGNMGHPEVQRTVDGALTKIVQAGRAAGMLVSTANVERYTRMGVRVVMTSFFPWIQAGTRELLERAAAGARG